MSEARAPPVPLRMRDVTVRYGELAALRDLSLDVHKGEFVALAGPNGSGKTTLLRVFLGFLSPASGRAELLGEDIEQIPIRERAHRVAWVPQEESPRDDVPIFEYVLYGRHSRLGRLESESSRDRALAMEMLASVGLADRAGDGILSISGGERQRAILARALAQEAPVLLLDEPTSHLDIGHQLDLLERVRSLSHDRGVTVVAALHDLNLAARFADRIVVLSHGRLYADGTPSSILSEELLARVWGVAADLRRDPRTGAPYLLPHRVLPSGPPPTNGFAPGPVHVVGGGGAASPTLRRLVDEGFVVSAGALHLLDTDTETAEALGVPSAVEIPFAPLGPEVRARHRELLGAARAIVVTAFAVGPSNLANLEDVVPFVGRTPTFVLERPAGPPWDFTSGAATRLLGEIRSDGGQSVPSVDELVDRVRVALALPRSSAGESPAAATG